jgi:hypothetical protein
MTRDRGAMWSFFLLRACPDGSQDRRKWCVVIKMKIILFNSAREIVALVRRKCFLFFKQILFGWEKCFSMKENFV